MAIDPRLFGALRPVLPEPEELETDPRLFGRPARRVPPRPLHRYEIYAEAEKRQPGPVLRTAEAIKRGAATGVGGVFRALRAPQQFAVTGPALLAAERLAAGETARPVKPWEPLAAGVRAVREDTSFRQVAETLGAKGTTAIVLGLVGDIALDPLWVVTPAKVARSAGLPAAIRALSASRAGRVIAEARPTQALGKALVYRFGQPAEYAQLAEAHSKEVTEAVEQAIDIGRRISQLPAPEQRAIRTFMTVGTDARRAAVLRGAARRGMNAQAIVELGQEAMQRDIALGQGLVDVGLMSEQTFVRWRGKHIRREYIRYEHPEQYIGRLAARNPEAAAKLEAKLKQSVGFVGETRPLRERLEFLRQRKDLSEDLRRELGEIFEAAHPVAKGQALAGRTIATRGFLNEVNARFASDTLQPGYKFVGDTVSLGPLRRKFLPEAIADDINRVLYRPGEAERLLRQGVGHWKYGKVVLNPATHGRNIMSNLMLADFAGTQPFKIHRYVQAARALVKRDEWYREARQAGTFLLDTYAATELPRFLELADNASAFRKGLAVLARPFRNAGDAYQFEEQLFKMAVYIDKRKAGVVAKQAAQIAEDALFNYRKVPQFIDRLRTTGIIPFVTFPYKALPRTAITLAEKPATVGKYGKIFRVFEPPTAAEEKKVLPAYMQDGWMRLPGYDAGGRVRYLNMQYILPFGDIGEVATLGGFMGRGGAKPSFLSSPYMDLAAAITTGIDPFTGREIAKTEGGWGRWLTNYTLPPLAGGYAAREIVAAARGRPVSVLGKAEPRTLGQALAASLAGLRMRPVDLREEQQKRVRVLEREIQDIQGDIRRWQRSRWITEEERAAGLEENTRRIRELLREIQQISVVRVPSTVQPPAETSAGRR